MADTPRPEPNDTKKEIDQILKLIQESEKNNASALPDETDPAQKSLWSSHFSDTPAEPVKPSANTATEPLNLEAHLSDTEDRLVVTAPASKKRTRKDDSIKKPEAKPSFGKRAINVLKNSTFIIKAVVYIAIILLVSAYLSYYVITMANDVFAFVKPDRAVTVTVPDGATVEEVSNLLQEDGVINEAWVFRLYMKYRSSAAVTFLSGAHELNATMNYSQIITALTVKTTTQEQITITIPEGYTVDEIIDLFVSNGIGTREGFTEAINNYPYKHEFVEALQSLGYPSSRKYRLEGYLYPDTYYFYKDSEEYLVINKLLNNFDEKFWLNYKTTFKADIDAAGLTFDDIVTLASMVQAEAGAYIDYEYIAYVFRHRLENPGSFPKLESDATVQYILPERTEELTQADLDTDSPYNTYLYDGLPPGAICNAGFDALTAAIYPDIPLDENGNELLAYFFVSNKAGKTYYAATRAEHLANKERVARENAAIENGEYSQAEVSNANA